MPLNANILGLELYNNANAYNEQEIAQDDIEQARLAFWKGLAEAVINHFKTNGVLVVPGTGLTAPNGAVGGTSNTGHIE